MTRDHTQIEELLAAAALGGLDEADLAELQRLQAEHDSDCEECRTLETEFGEVAAGLAFSLEPAPVAAGAADRVLARARLEQGSEQGPERGPAEPALSVVPEATGEPEDAAAAAAAAPTTSLDQHRARRGRRVWGGLVAAAAAIALVVAITTIGPGAQEPGSVTAAQQFATFTPSQAGEGELAMAYTHGEPGIVVWGEGIADPGAAQVIELWTFDGDTPASAGCFSPVGGRLAAAIPDVEATDVMAVTVEPSSCPDAPTGDVTFSLELA